MKETLTKERITNASAEEIQQIAKDIQALPKNEGIDCLLKIIDDLEHDLSDYSPNHEALLNDPILDELTSELSNQPTKEEEKGE